MVAVVQEITTGPDFTSAFFLTFPLLLLWIHMVGVCLATHPALQRAGAY